MDAGRKNACVASGRSNYCIRLYIRNIVLLFAIAREVGWKGIAWSRKLMRKINFIKAHSVRVLASDAFNRSNGALGNADIGGAWVATAGTFAISSNKAIATASDTSVATLRMGQVNYDISADCIWRTGESVAIVGRSPASGNDNHVRLRANGTSLLIEKRISTTNTTLASVPLSWTSGDMKNLRLSCSGNLFVGYVDGVGVVSATDDNITKTNVYVGIQAAKADAIPTSTFDNFLVIG